MSFHRSTTRVIAGSTAVGALALGGGYLSSSIIASAASTPEATPAPAQAAPPAQPSAFVPIAAYRSYDSRLDADAGGKIYLQEQRFVDVALDLDGDERIPDDATAVSFNVTVTDTEGAGFVQISAPGNTFGETSTVNWTDAGQTVANGGDALMYEGDTFENNIVFHVDGAGGAGAHVIIDITGYYVPID